MQRVSPCNRTGQFLRQAAEDGGGVPVLGGAEGILLCNGRAQIQHVGQFLQGILERAEIKGLVCRRFLQNGALKVDDCKRQRMGERAEHTVLDTRLPLVHIAVLFSYLGGQGTLI